MSSRHSSRIYKNDIGARIVLNIKRRDGSAYDVSGAAVMTLRLTPPSGTTTKNFAASFATSPYGNGTGTDGVVEYRTTTTADVDESGRWQGQGYFDFSASDKRHTQPFVLHVGEVPS